MSTRQVRRCPECGDMDDSNRHVIYNRHGDDLALHRECCGCELCVADLLNEKELSDG